MLFGVNPFRPRDPQFPRLVSAVSCCAVVLWRAAVRFVTSPRASAGNGSCDGNGDIAEMVTAHIINM